MGRFNSALRPNESLVSQIGDNAKSTLSAREVGQLGSDLLGHSVNDIGTHGIGAVHEQMNDQRLVVAQRFDLDVSTTATSSDQIGGRLVTLPTNAFLCFVDGLGGLHDVRHVSNFDLSDGQVSQHLCFETAALAGHFGAVRGCADDGGFFNNHRKKDLRFVDDEVGGNAKREREQADDVFGHEVGGFEEQRIIQRVERTCVQADCLFEFSASGEDGKLVEARQSACITAHPDLLQW